MAAVEEETVRKECVSSADENDAKPTELPLETEDASDSGCCNADEEGGREDMAQMPEGEMIESGDGRDDETGGDDDEDDDDEDYHDVHTNDDHYDRQEVFQDVQADVQDAHTEVQGDVPLSVGAGDRDHQDDHQDEHQDDHPDDGIVDNDETDENKESGSDYLEEGKEREEGDGEEGYGEESSRVTVNSKDKVLDFDEDRRNPQYIPKKGGFYEHDDRLGEEMEPPGEGAVVEDEKTKLTKKKLWRAEGMWQHDHFLTDEQVPKSRDELISTYGYDIRNEDGPPRARRRRRYGRGPMKYTRNWEDEEAYGKPGSQRGADEDDEQESVRGGYRGGRSRGRGFGYRGGRPNRGRGGGWNQRNYGNETQHRSRDSYRGNGDVGDEEIQSKNRSLNESDRNHRPASRDDYPALPNNRGNASEECDENAFRGRKTSRKCYVKSPKNRGDTDMIKTSPRQIADESVLVCGIKKLEVSSEPNTAQRQPAEPRERENRKEATEVAPTQHYAGGMSHERRQATVPPRLQDSSSNRPKRYSSQRQRQAGDVVQPEHQQSSRHQDHDPPSMAPRFYETNYQQQQQPVYSDVPVAPNSVQQVTSGTAPAMMPQHYQGYEASYHDTYAMRPMASPSSRGMYNPVPLAAAAGQQQQQQQQQPQQLPAVIPAPYIASTGGNMMSYGPPPPPAYPPPPQYHPHPHHPHHQQYSVAPYGSPSQPPPPVSQTQEIFRCGMAYYNAPPPIQTLPKRPRAAIPIVPPPELEDQRKGDSQDYHEIPERLEHFSEKTVKVDN